MKIARCKLRIASKKIELRDANSELRVKKIELRDVNSELRVKR